MITYSDGIVAELFHERVRGGKRHEVLYDQAAQISRRVCKSHPEHFSEKLMLPGIIGDEAKK
jgi:hypothetical protein